MSLFSITSKRRLLSILMWRFPKALDSHFAHHGHKRENNTRRSSKSKGSGVRQLGEKAVPNKLRNPGRVSSELQKLALEDFSSEWERPARLKPSVESSDRHEIVFGVAPCLLALTQAHREAFKLFVKDGEAVQRSSLLKVCEEANQRGVPIQRVSKRDLDRMCSGRVHQGVCLQATPLSYLTNDSDPSSNSTPLWLVLDRIQDPMNLGAILRSAYFLGVDRVATSVYHSCPLTPVVSKASAGIMEVMNVYGYKNLEDMVRVKAARGWRVVGTVAAEVRQSGLPVTPCSDFRMTTPTLLLIGGEGDGLSQKLLNLCQMLVTIPAGRQLLPGVESLNVSVATGILLHSLLASARLT
ncbi:rRNA methyltransferase 1, mitochondrial isoform X6 [Syngnathoides biaculeatus]|uniref:rRNA methyltransferase 1, mitochondrial isoform X6 n=1 Tax=Syngnathoides biaculeatus TaxID=300417 RepID=UPI002ADE1E81|nr:rRNA methyltransferase 1, mitochondrial isoform X6 [Syngnathoides biaculeatus]